MRSSWNTSFDAPCLELSLNYCIAGLLQTTKFPGFDAPCLELSLNFVKKIFIFFIKAQEFRCSLFGAFFKLWRGRAVNAVSLPESFDAPCLELSLNLNCASDKACFYILFRCSLFGAFFKFLQLSWTPCDESGFRCSLFGAFFKFLLRVF